jgi:ABC-type lipoprotein export system ATPase subunit
MKVVDIKDLTKIYGDGENAVKALKNANLTIEQGEFIAVVGTSGSGKSTFLNLVGGLDVPTQGEIFIKGKNIASLRKEEKTIFRRRNVGFVRVAIARALANKPAIILADEPTGNLDSRTTSEVAGLLKTSAKKYNQTIIMVTHNELLAQSCDRIIHIEDGVMREAGE